ncbi:MAG: M18 family aminopeptidase [Chlamydiia bacterium]|nr:M18 family aminopeptidase [Chlamydiia bacterium]
MSHKQDPVINNLLAFMQASPTAWHAVEQATAALQERGFKELKEEEPWKLKPGEGYYVTRNGSAFCAFILPSTKPIAARVIGSHTDSPALKLKPHSEFSVSNMTMLAVEVYGSPLVSSWFNRDLGIAGRMVYNTDEGDINETLVNITEHPVVVPQLAIHLDRDSKEINKQQHLNAIASISLAEGGSYLRKVISDQVKFKSILAYDLFLYPLEPARLVGENKELISSYRFDNLGSAHAALHALTTSHHAHYDQIKMIVSWDNEEVGSSTAQGAGSPFLPHVIERIALALGMSREEYLRVMSQSHCISVDQAHALHPNYLEKHDPAHQPLLGGGIVLKTHAGQRYASDARSSAIIAQLCANEKLPLQRFSSRNDIPCGTTIGPVNATVTGMSTVDIGCPQLSMHSVRELAACSDHLAMCQLLTAFFN